MNSMRAQLISSTFSIDLLMAKPLNTLQIQRDNKMFKLNQNILDLILHSPRASSSLSQRVLMFNIMELV